MNKKAWLGFFGIFLGIWILIFAVAVVLAFARYGYTGETLAEGAKKCVAENCNLSEEEVLVIDQLEYRRAAVVTCSAGGKIYAVPFDVSYVFTRYRPVKPAVVQGTSDEFQETSDKFIVAGFGGEFAKSIVFSIPKTGEGITVYMERTVYRDIVILVLLTAAIFAAAYCPTLRVERLRRKRQREHEAEERRNSIKSFADMAREEREAKEQKRE